MSGLVDGLRARQRDRPGISTAFEIALDAAEADESVAVIVLSSALRVFSAGADATWMAGVVAEAGPLGLLEQFRATMDRFRALAARLRTSPLLIVAALGGHTLAGGLELAAACDLRFAADTPKLQIGVPEMDLFGALPSGGGGVQFLSRILGPSAALLFVLDAKPVDPQRAFVLGLVDRLLDPDQLLTATRAFAEDVARKAGRIGVSAAKRAILDAHPLALDTALEVDSAVHWDAMRRGNFLPGVQSFVERFASSSAR